MDFHNYLNCRNPSTDLMLHHNCSTSNSEVWIQEDFFIHYNILKTSGLQHTNPQVRQTPLLQCLQLQAWPCKTTPKQSLESLQVRVDWSQERFKSFLWPQLQFLSIFTYYTNKFLLFTSLGVVNLMDVALQYLSFHKKGRHRNHPGQWISK